jgi:tetratricopeptide (TPR) repeat protein
MNRNATILVYVALIAATAFFGYAFRASFQTNTSVQPTERSTNQAANTGEPAAEAPSRHAGRMMAYGILGLMCVSVLGLLVARDISNFVAHRVEKLIFDEDLEGERNPEYEEAEKVWANGQHLEAIQLMRNYLQIHPREQYVALRIAEIYEKDLANYVAASLEYEEILRKNLPPERWGWAAIHLSNLYSGKLNKTEEATALLRRIITDHPTVAAAKKARERLGEPEPAPEPLPSTVAAEEPKAPPSNLPPGFRPK